MTTPTVKRGLWRVRAWAVRLANGVIWPSSMSYERKTAAVFAFGGARLIRVEIRELPRRSKGGRKLTQFRYVFKGRGSRSSAASLKGQSG